MKAAVEWLVEQICGEQTSVWQKEIEQAKEMEKQQHGKTWDCAMKNYELRGGNFTRAWADFDDYYNENFKK